MVIDVSEFWSQLIADLDAGIELSIALSKVPTRILVQLSVLFEDNRLDLQKENPKQMEFIKRLSDWLQIFESELSQRTYAQIKVTDSSASDLMAMHNKTSLAMKTQQKKKSLKKP